MRFSSHLSFLFLIAAFATDLSAQTVQFRRGDADGNGCVEALTDALYINNSIFVSGSPGLACEAAGDVDASSGIDISDVVMLLSWGFSSGAEPFAPGPMVCGPDPSPSGLSCDFYDCAPCGSVPNPDFTLRLSDEFSATVGPAIPIAVTLDNSAAVEAWSFGVCHDASFVEVGMVAHGAAIVPMTLGFDSVSVLPGQGWTAGAVVSFSGADSLAAGTDQELYVVSYGAMNDGVTELTFCGSLGSPPVPLSITSGGSSHLPEHSDVGIIQIDVALENTFIRGDVNGDQSVDEVDYDTLSNYILPTLFGVGGGTPVGCDGSILLDAGDINDNEHFSVADLLLFQAYLSCGETLSGPTVCGTDLDNDPGGFDFLDTNYVVSAGAVSITGSPGETMAVEIDLRVWSPQTPVKAIQVGLEYGAALTPGVVAFVPEPGLLADFSGVLNDGSHLVVTVGRVDCADMLPASSSFQTVGTLHFTLAPFGIFPPINWLPEILIGDILYRATVVDNEYQDHHPALGAGYFQFARGNANNFDAFVDLADAIYTLSYLFQGGPAPTCEDAADANNDDRIDLGDAIYTLSFLFGAGAPLAPWPQCGWDSNIDLLLCQDPQCP